MEFDAAGLEPTDEGGLFEDVKQAEYVYEDVTERSNMAYTQSDVDSAISALENEANLYFERALYSPPGLGIRECDRAVVNRMRAKLLTATPFESESGDVIVSDKGALATVVGGYFDHEEGEPVLHLETTGEDGTTYRAMVNYSGLIPVLSS